MGLLVRIVPARFICFADLSLARPRSSVKGPFVLLLLLPFYSPSRLLQTFSILVHIKSRKEEDIGQETKNQALREKQTKTRWNRNKPDASPTTTQSNRRSTSKNASPCLNVSLLILERSEMHQSEGDSAKGKNEGERKSRRVRIRRFVASRRLEGTRRIKRIDADLSPSSVTASETAADLAPRTLLESRIPPRRE